MSKASVIFTNFTADGGLTTLYVSDCLRSPVQVYRLA